MDENTKSKLLESRTWIREELERCIGFWLNNGMDPVNGGVYTCLDREGKVFSTDKSVWMQGRCGWIFSWLCHLYGVKDEWLKAAKSLLLAVPSVRRKGRVAEGSEELSGLYGGALHQP